VEAEPTLTNLGISAPEFLCRSSNAVTIENYMSRFGYG
jgi:hypothetical protein